MTTPEGTDPGTEQPPESETFTETITVTETITENRPVRHLANRGGGTHIAEADLPLVTNEHIEQPDIDPADRPQTTGMVGDYTYTPIFDELEHEMPTDDLPDKVVPRHDRYAAENTGVVPQRVIPGGITNAHPDFTVGAAMDPTTGEVLASAPIPPDHVVREETGAATPEEDATAALTGEDTPKTGVINPPAVSSEPVVTGPATMTDPVAGDGGNPPRQVVQTEPDPPADPGPVPDGTVLSPVGDASHTEVPDAAAADDSEHTTTAPAGDVSTAQVGVGPIDGKSTPNAEDGPQGDSPPAIEVGDPSALRDPGDPPPTDPQSTPALTGTPPAQDASVAEWRAFAVSQGMDPVEADESSLDALQARFAAPAAG